MTDALLALTAWLAFVAFVALKHARLTRRETLFLLLWPVTYPVAWIHYGVRRIMDGD